jgi:hypothetical protein
VEGGIIRLVEDINSTKGFCARDFLTALRIHLQSDHSALAVRAADGLVKIYCVEPRKAIKPLLHIVTDNQKRLSSFLLDGRDSEALGKTRRNWLDFCHGCDADRLVVILGPHLRGAGTESDRWGIALLNPDLLSPVGPMDCSEVVRPLRTLEALVRAWSTTVVARRRNFEQLIADCTAKPASLDPEQVSDLIKLLESPHTLGHQSLLLAVRSGAYDWIGDVGNHPSSLKSVPRCLTRCKDCQLREWRFCGRGGLLGESFDGLWKWGPLYATNPLKLGGLKNRPAASDSEPLKLSEIKDDASEFAEIALRQVLPQSLNRSSLLRFFFGKVLRGSSLLASLPPSTLRSDSESAMQLRNLTRVAHHVFAGFPLDEDTIESIVALLSQYVHHELGVTQRLDLKLHLLFAARGEPALHSLKLFYRDHFFHALEVCFLGHLLMEIEVEPARPLWHLIARNWKLNPQDSDTRQCVLRGWYVAALLHDIGYWIDIQDAVANRLDFFRNTPPLAVLAKGLRGSLDDLSAALAAENFEEYGASDRPGKDHGVIAARHLAEMISRGVKFEPCLNGIEYRDAVRAIAVHNSRKHHVSFKRSPLGFLLILCDTIQEWNRTRFGAAVAPTEILARMTSGAPGAHAEDDLVSAFGLGNVHVSPKGVWQLDAGKPLVLRLDYAPIIQQGSGVFNLWVDSTCNLQRLSFDGLKKLKIAIEYVTPGYRFSMPPDEPYPQLYRLRDAAAETHMSCLEHWFPPFDSIDPDKPELGWKLPIAHRFDRERNQEMLRLNLRALTSQNPRSITADVAAFRSSLARWKEISNDQDHRGDYGGPESPPS